ncbi:DedA family protein [Streptomyces sp. NPDC001982]|uniref:DedA family protein n=1 Tax=Streptomyces sp. NPDC001982 TaxID=3154405 RepID=UPI0033266175
MDGHHLIAAAGSWSYVMVFAVVAGETGAFIGLLLPAETLVVLAAAMAQHGELDPFLLTIAVVAGGFAGDSIGYALGHRYEGHPGAKRQQLRMSAGGRGARAGALLRRRGGAAVFTGRFVGFVRPFVPFAAGAVGMPYRRFLLYSTAASVMWGTGNVLAGYFLGSSAGRILRTAGIAGVAGLAAATAAVVLVLLRLRQGGERRRGADAQAGGDVGQGRRAAGWVVDRSGRHRFRVARRC